eukprot:7128990-Alexandrium_andersonii.AAC.1
MCIRDSMCTLRSKDRGKRLKLPSTPSDALNLPATAPAAARMERFKSVPRSLKSATSLNDMPTSSYTCLLSNFWTCAEVGKEWHLSGDNLLPTASTYLMVADAASPRVWKFMKPGWSSS